MVDVALLLLDVVVVPVEFRDPTIAKRSRRRDASRQRLVRTDCVVRVRRLVDEKRKKGDVIALEDDHDAVEVRILATKLGVLALGAGDYPQVVVGTLGDHLLQVLPRGEHRGGHPGHVRLGHERERGGWGGEGGKGGWEGRERRGLSD